MAKPAFPYQKLKILSDMKIPKDQIVRFDWALKALLRSKADFKILEGFLTSLLGRPIHIISIIESEGNKEFEENKSNRVDLLASEENGSRIIIEVQNETEDSYFHRMLFGSSKAINDFMKSGQGYENVTKIYSVNIVYFNLGHGSDYIYHGKTEFRGLHNNELLELSPKLRAKFSVERISQIFPEYYILKVNDFDRLAKTPLDQWMYFLKHSELPENADAPGLREAAERLRLLSLTPEQRMAYFKYIDNMVSLEEVMKTAFTDGEFKGRTEGLEKGREEGERKGKLEIAQNMLKDGIPIDRISLYTGLSVQEIEDL